MIDVVAAASNPTTWVLGALLAIAVFGVFPGLSARVLSKAYPRRDPRRKEMVAEVYAVPRMERLLWVGEQLERVLTEALPARLAERRESRPRVQARNPVARPERTHWSEHEYLRPGHYAAFRWSHGRVILRVTSVIDRYGEARRNRWGLLEDGSRCWVYGVVEKGHQLSPGQSLSVPFTSLIDVSPTLSPLLDPRRDFGRRDAPTPPLI